MALDEQSALTVIEHREGIAALLPTLRRRILDQLHVEPDSATGLSRKFGLARQKVNYHVRALEEAGFLELAGEEKRRGCTERRFRPTARAYLISPDILGNLGVEVKELRDQYSSAYLIGLAAGVVRDVARMRRKADEAGKGIATLALHVDIRFRSPAHRTAFTEELADTIARLAAQYHDESPESRPYRFVVGGHPIARQSGKKGEKS